MDALEGGFIINLFDKQSNILVQAPFNGEDAQVALMSSVIANLAISDEARQKLSDELRPSKIVLPGSSDPDSEATALRDRLAQATARPEGNKNPPWAQ